MTITVPAVRIKQGRRFIYATSFKVKYLMSPDFYSTKHLDPETDEDGYQRILNEPRAKQLADYIVKGQETGDAFLPTSVFLATESDIAFNEENNTITFDIDAIKGVDNRKGFSVVDGQHRLEGLCHAMKRDSSVGDFEIPVNIAYNLPYIDQMVHFLVVNKMQRSVDPGVEQQIIARLTKIKNIENIPNLPKGIKNDVEKGSTARALAMVLYLNTKSDSPWQGKIRMANKKKKDFPNTTIEQKSFIPIMKKHILTIGHPLWDAANKDSEEQRRLFLNYWKAIANLLDPKDGAETVLYKSLGVTLFSMFSTPLFYKLNFTVKNYTVDVIEQHLKECFNNMDGDYKLIGTPKWWLSGEKGEAGGLNSYALAKLSAMMNEALK